MPLGILANESKFFRIADSRTMASFRRTILGREIVFLAQLSIGGIGLRENKKMLVQIQGAGKLK